MDNQGIQKIVDQIVGTEGILRIPSWWMHKILSDLVKYCKDNEGASVPIKEYVESQLNLVGKTIEDLDTRLDNIESHAEGVGTITTNKAEHASGKYNKSIKSEDAAQKTHFSIGIGTSNSNRKNAFEIKANGDIYIIGVGGYDGTNSDSAQTLQEILANL